MTHISLLNRFDNFSLLFGIELNLCYDSSFVRHKMLKSILNLISPNTRHRNVAQDLQPDKSSDPLVWELALSIFIKRSNFPHISKIVNITKIVQARDILLQSCIKRFPNSVSLTDVLLFVVWVL